jgi:predicted Zn-dependent protease
MKATHLDCGPTRLQPPVGRAHFLSEAECQDIARRLAQVAHGGGYNCTTFYSSWTGYVRWARNQISTSGEVRNDFVNVRRNVNGAENNWTIMNDTSPAALVAVARRAERLAKLEPERPQSDLIARLANEPTSASQLFFESTYTLDAEQRAAAAVTLARATASAGMLSAGYIQVEACALAVIDTMGHSQYQPYTTARFSVTVRDPKGVGSGWAGVDWPDWSRIDGPKLAALALDKCIHSRNPVALEPGRYTTILEPQAVCNFCNQLLSDGYSVPSAKPGQQLIDARLTVSEDAMDPDLGFPTFQPTWQRVTNNHRYFHPATWIEHGVFKQWSWRRGWVDDKRSYQGRSLCSSGAYRVTVNGETTSSDEMVASTKRGLLVTRFDNILLLEGSSYLQRGYTRDGLWLIENGKITKAIKNLQFTESILFVLNNVEQIGVPQRVFRPKFEGDVRELPEPVIVPALKIRDFSFTALSDAI